MLTSIQLFQLLKNKLGDREVEALVDFVETKQKEAIDANNKILATKEDMSVFKDDMNAFKTDLNRLEIKIAECKTDIIRWVFALFLPLMLAIIGLYFRH